MKVPWNPPADVVFEPGGGQGARFEVAGVEYEELGAVFGEVVVEGEEPAIVFGGVGGARNEQGFTDRAVGGVATVVVPVWWSILVRVLNSPAGPPAPARLV
nr:hypothetical protein [Nocardia wallacei]